jgi:hypothetical protein
VGYVVRMMRELRNWWRPFRVARVQRRRSRYYLLRRIYDGMVLFGRGVVIPGMRRFVLVGGRRRVVVLLHGELMEVGKTVGVGCGVGERGFELGFLETDVVVAAAAAVVVAVVAVVAVSVVAGVAVVAVVEAATAAVRVLRATVVERAEDGVEGFEEFERGLAKIVLCGLVMVVALASENDEIEVKQMSVEEKLVVAKNDIVQIVNSELAMHAEAAQTVAEPDTEVA